MAAEAEEAARKAEEEAQAVREAAGSGQAVVIMHVSLSAIHMSGEAQA